MIKWNLVQVVQVLTNGEIEMSVVPPVEKLNEDGTIRAKNNQITISITARVIVVRLIVHRLLIRWTNSKLLNSLYSFAIVWPTEIITTKYFE